MDALKIDKYRIIVAKSLVPFLVVLVLSDIIFNLVGELKPYWVFIAFSFVVLHCYVNMGTDKTLFFFAITVLLGFFSELVGTMYGWIYGAYYYIPRPPWMILGYVPIQTPLSWSVIIYICFGVTNTIVQGFKKRIQGIVDSPRNCLVFIMLLASIDGLAAMNLDMIMDPVAAGHSWVWVGGGAFYDIPITNFLGWFAITFIATFTFRIYKSTSKSNNEQSMKTMTYVPLLLYIIYFMKLSFGALFGNIIDPSRQCYPELVLIGAAAMMPFILIALLAIISGRNIEN